MTYANYAVIQRILGQISGVAYGTKDEDLQSALFDAIEALDAEINSIVKNEGIKEDA